jgi:hypothetical protein
VTGHCAGCGAKLRRSKPSWASCDPCQDKADRRAYDLELAERQRLAAISKPCKSVAAARRREERRLRLDVLLVPRGCS